MGWWSEWLFPLLIASGVLLLFKDSLLLIVLLWVLYIRSGADSVKAHPSKENQEELNTNMIICGIVLIIVIIFNIAV